MRAAEDIPSIRGCQGDLRKNRDFHPRLGQLPNLSFPNSDSIGLSMVEQFGVTSKGVPMVYPWLCSGDHYTSLH